MSQPLQGTVSAYDAATRSGRLLLDDGRELAFASGALAGDVRLLRCGQRVRYELADGAGVGAAVGHIARLTLLTLPWP